MFKQNVWGLKSFQILIPKVKTDNPNDRFGIPYFSALSRIVSEVGWN